MLLENIILATIIKFTIFCCRLVFAVTYAVLGRIEIEKPAWVKQHGGGGGL